MTKKRLALKITAGVGALLLIVFCLFMAASFLGNPLSTWLSQNTAQSYANKTYPTRSWTAEESNYNFKWGTYVVRLSSGENIDERFTVEVRGGEIVSDMYQEDIVEYGAVRWRIAEEYDKEIRPLLDQIMGKENHTSYISPYFSDTIPTEGIIHDITHGMALSEQAVDSCGIELMVRTTVSSPDAKTGTSLLKQVQQALQANAYEPPYYYLVLEPENPHGKGLSAQISREELEKLDEAELAEFLENANPFADTKEKE